MLGKLILFEIFEAIVETGSFTKAGELLGLTQSAVSHAIASLETELNITLLYRNRPGITLTESGKMLLRHIKEINKDIEQIKQEIAAINGLELGSIKIGSFLSTSKRLIPGMISNFIKLYPNIQIELFEGSYEEIDEWLANGKIDFGFITDIDRFDAVPLVQDKFIILLPEDHPLKAKKEINIKEIIDNPLIMPSKGWDKKLSSLFYQYGLTPNIRYHIEHVPTMLAMVQEGLGYAIVPELAVLEKPDNVNIVNLTPELKRIISIGFRSSSYLSPATQAFINEAKKWVKSKGYIIPS